jgi:hypothetical protein
MTDPDFVKTLTDNDFIVWAGDIRYRDTYQSMALYVAYFNKTLTGSVTI